MDDNVHQAFYPEDFTLISPFEFHLRLMDFSEIPWYTSPCLMSVKHLPFLRLASRLLQIVMFSFFRRLHSPECLASSSSKHWEATHSEILINISIFTNYRNKIHHNMQINWANKPPELQIKSQSLAGDIELNDDISPSSQSIPSLMHPWKTGQIQLLICLESVHRFYMQTRTKQRYHPKIIYNYKNRNHPNVIIPTFKIEIKPPPP